METKERSKMTLTTPSDTEVVLSREFDAPRALVFDAYTKPEHVRNWWGCRLSSLSVCEIDLHVGGEYRFVLRMNDGSGEFPFKGVYKEISRPERVVYTQVFDVPPFNEGEALVTTTFEEENGRTRLTEHIACGSKEARDGMLATGMEHGAAEAFDKLEELIEGGLDS
jgi:uncharacterized protein YndB with AHSA1/START domain